MPNKYLLNRKRETVTEDIVVANDDGMVYAYDGSDGKESWSFYTGKTENPSALERWIKLRTSTSRSEYER